MSEQKSIWRLLGIRRFLPFFITQFLGAFNDNLFRVSLTLLVTYGVGEWTLGGAEVNTSVILNLAVALFMLPFFLFSALAGQLADKYEKSRLIRRIKLLEIAIMCAAALAFYWHSAEALLVLLFLMGTQSTLFGPVKYGLLPQHLKTDELMGGNGLVEMGTFVAIIAGAIGAGALVGLHETGTESLHLYAIMGSIVIVAVLGWIASRSIPEAAPAAPNLKLDWNIARQTLQMIRYAKEDRAIYLSILGISWFWAYGSIYLAQFPDYVRINLGGNEQVATLILAVFSLGIGLGSVLADRLADGRVEIGLVPLGAAGMTIFGIDIYFADVITQSTLYTPSEFWNADGSGRVIFDLTAIGLFGGFFIVPLYALVQHNSPEDKRSRIIAANNILNALFMVVAAVFAMGIRGAGLDIPTLFLISACIGLAVCIYIFKLVPLFLIRFIVWLLMKTMYRLKLSGTEHVPKEGAVVVVANHVSFIDPLLLTGITGRIPRFVMDHNIYKTPGLHWLFKLAKGIPICPAHVDEQMLNSAYDQISEALENDELVIIFPEGKITHHGEINEFRQGIDLILKRNPVPVVPVGMSGLWGSFFSRKYGSGMSKPFARGVLSKLEINVGELVPVEQANAPALQEKVTKLRGSQL